MNKNNFKLIATIIMVAIISIFITTYLFIFSNLTFLTSVIIGYIPLLIIILYFIRKGEK